MGGSAYEEDAYMQEDVKEEPKCEPEEEEYSPQKVKKEKTKAKKPTKTPIKQETKIGKKGEPEVWKWWEEEKKDDGKKWYFLEHNGPLFAPEYERLPKNVRFYYDGAVMKLSLEAEEVATFYGRMLDHDYTTK